MRRPGGWRVARLRLAVQALRLGRAPLACAMLWLPCWQAPVLAQTVPAGPTPQIYTCVDAQGRKLTSDRPIPQCLDREQLILNPSGTVKSRIGPKLTAKELEAQEAERRAEQAEQTRLEEEKRRDRSLLMRYPSRAAHDKERAEAQAQIQLVIKTASLRVKDLNEQRAKLEEEMAFYAKDPRKAPLKLRRQIEELDQALAAQGRFMADKQTEIERVNDRFDAELSRLEPLWQRASPAR